MEISGIKRIYISVESMSMSLAFYESIVGMQVIAKENLSHDEVSSIWRLPEGTRGKLAILRSAIQSTELVLIEFVPHSGVFIRDQAENWDIGLFDLAFAVRDLDSLHGSLTGAGYQFPTEPVLYQPTFHPSLKVRYSILMGPDRVPIPHMQYLEPKVPPITGDYGRIVDSAQIVEDMAQALAFYQGLLGLKVVAQAEFPAGMLDDLLHLPSQTKGRIALLNEEGGEAPLLELIELSVPGRRLSEIAAPPNVGLFMLGFETDDLDALVQRIGAARASSEPKRSQTAPTRGQRRIFVEGPSGVNLEFVEGVAHAR